jgi:tripartite-type tricarboxylate transporter receptor subunit TctC
MMKISATVLTIMVAATVAALDARAQNFPDRPIRLIVAYPAGGPTDTVARVSTQGLGPALGGSLVVENVAGAGGRIGVRDVARAAPDGYTLLLGGTNDNALTPALYKTLEYDPMKDFAPVAALAIDSQAIVVNPAVPVHTIAELVRYAKDHPGKLTSGAAVGISPQLMLEFFRVRTGTDIVFVPYKGGAPAIADVLGNHIQINVSAKSVLLPLIKAGKLNALAVSSAERWPDGFPTSVWFGLMAPAGTPTDVIAKLNAAENARLKAPETQAAIGKLGLETRPLSPQEFGAMLADEARLWKSVADETGVHLE